MHYRDKDISINSKRYYILLFNHEKNEAYHLHNNLYNTYEKASTATCKPGIPPTSRMILTILLLLCLSAATKYNRYRSLLSSEGVDLLIRVN